MTRTRALALLANLLLVGVIAATPGAAGPIRSVGPSSDLVPEETALVRFLLADRAQVERLVDSGADLAESVSPTAQGWEVFAVVTPTELAALAEEGLIPAGVIETAADWRERLAERDATLAQQAAVAQAVDEVHIRRADYFVARGGAQYVSVEASHPAGILPTDLLLALADAGPGTPAGAGGAAQMSRFTDAGVYLYHRVQFQVTARPDRITVVSNLGGTATRSVRDWVGAPPEPTPGYLSDFITNYMHPTELYDRIEQLAAEYPDIAEIVELPEPSNGYRRHARAVLGSADASRVLVISKAYGHEGGNAITVEAVTSDAPGAPLTVVTDGSKITVRLATNALGAPSSTAAEVAAALTASAGDLVEAHTFRRNAGAGVVAPGAVALSDGLKAPAEISREPFPVRALRIRGDRQATKTGVFIYSQEHAREWVTPLVSIEVAERLVRNYGSDPATTELVDELDIFIVPSVNPDGSHYSFFDFASQRKSMTNRCAAADSDPAGANSWGVDLNRNFGVGTLRDGYSGASASCTSGTYAGPEPLSEPEARNEVWLTEQFPNIRFAMNIHSFGNYFMWPPGAYKTAGREALPRPTLGEEQYYWKAGEHILDAVRGHRGTTVTPARTGPVIDVLYSAAGNSADHHWYANGIYGWDFEVGGIGFQPAFAEGHQEAMEFANGTIALLEVARDYQADDEAPTSTVQFGDGTAWFTTSEPATIYYTLDGSAPSFRSTVYETAGMRDLDGERLAVAPGATVSWFAVDVAGNVEGGYDPTTPSGTPRVAVAHR